MRAGLGGGAPPSALGAVAASARARQRASGERERCGRMVMRGDSSCRHIATGSGGGGCAMRSDLSCARSARAVRHATAARLSARSRSPSPRRPGDSCTLGARPDRAALGVLRSAGSATIRTSTPGSPSSRRASSDVAAAQQPPEAAPRRGRADQHVGAAERAREVDRDRRDVLALLDAQARARASRSAAAAPPGGARSSALGARPGGRTTSTSSSRVETLRRAPGAPHDVLGLAARASTSASSRSLIAWVPARRRARAPSSSRRADRRAALAHQPLDLDVLGDLAQRRLAQRREVLDLEEVVERRRHALGAVDLAGAQPRDQRLGGEVDQHHLVGLGEDLVGDRLAHRRAGQLRRPGR